MLGRLRSLKVAVFGRSAVTTRLAGELRAAEIELDVTRELYRDSTGVGVSEEHPSWEGAARDAIASAWEELSEGRPEVGWVYYFVAKRMELVALRDISETSFPARATVLYREAVDVLDRRELETVEDLLLADGEIDPDVTLARMYEASKVLQDHYVDLYLRIETFREQLWQFIVIGTLTIGLIVRYAWVSGPLFGGTSGGGGDALLIPVVLFGVLGASVSGLLSLDETSAEVQREGQPLSRWLSLARVVLGGAAAIALFAFLQSGLLQLGPLTAGLVLAVSFVAEFTERLLMRAVAALVGDEADPCRT